MLELEVEAVLFDSDGVLIDSHRVVEMAWRQLSAEFELDVERLVNEQPGVRATDTLGRHLDPGRASLAVARLEDLEVELTPQVEAMPGAVRLTGHIGRFPHAIVTSASRRLAEVRWATAGIVPPRVTVTADDVTAGKPDPAPYLMAADLLGVDPARCVMFEDSPSGGASAVATGGDVIAVGDHVWHFEPAARIDDLCQVAFTPPNRSGGPGHMAIRTNP